MTFFSIFHFKCRKNKPYIVCVCTVPIPNIVMWIICIFLNNFYTPYPVHSYSWRRVSIHKTAPPSISPPERKSQKTTKDGFRISNSSIHKIHEFNLQSLSLRHFLQVVFFCQHDILWMLPLKRLSRKYLFLTTLKKTNYVKRRIRTTVVIFGVFN